MVKCCEGRERGGEKCEFWIWEVKTSQCCVRAIEQIVARLRIFMHLWKVQRCNVKERMKHSKYSAFRNNFLPRFCFSRLSAYSQKYDPLVIIAFLLYRYCILKRLYSYLYLYNLIKLLFRKRFSNSRTNYFSNEFACFVMFDFWQQQQKKKLQKSKWMTKQRPKFTTVEKCC